MLGDPVSGAPTARTQVANSMAKRARGIPRSGIAMAIGSDRNNRIRMVLPLLSTHKPLPARLPWRPARHRCAAAELLLGAAGFGVLLGRFAERLALLRHNILPAGARGVRLNGRRVALHVPARSLLRSLAAAAGKNQKGRERLRNAHGPGIAG